MKPVLLFDYGDTLVQYYRREEFAPILRQAIYHSKNAIVQLGYPTPSEATIQQRVQAENYEAKNNRVRPLEKRLGRIFGLDYHKLDSASWLKICSAFLQPIFAISKIYPDTYPALEQFRKKGYRIGILSNSPWGAPSQPWYNELERYGLLKLCEKAIFCSDLGWRKPAQPMFHQALLHFGCPPEACFFVGDNPRWDILGALRAGITPVFINRTGQPAIKTQHQISALFELDNIIKNW